MQADAHLWLIFEWYFRELSSKLGAISTIEMEGWARDRLRAMFGPLFDILHNHQTERSLTDSLVKSQNLINRVSSREIAFFFAMRVMLGELEAIAQESIDRAPPEIRKVIEEIKEQFAHGEEVFGVPISLN